jgi:hypothetical protein
MLDSKLVQTTKCYILKDFRNASLKYLNLYTDLIIIMHQKVPLNILLVMTKNDFDILWKGSSNNGSVLVSNLQWKLLMGKISEMTLTYVNVLTLGNYTLLTGSRAISNITRIQETSLKA